MMKESRRSKDSRRMEKKRSQQDKIEGETEEKE